jgi:hypothetical protein
MTVICDECGAKMPTRKILELHKNKRHGGTTEEEKTVIAPQETKPGEQTETTLTQESTAVVPEGMVEIVSADNRELEVSIGREVWKGKTILIPKEVEKDVRRILGDGGFFLKD